MTRRPAAARGKGPFARLCAGLPAGFYCGGQRRAKAAAAAEKHLCRTQIRVSLPQGLDTLLREPIGNHHLIVLGHYARRVQEFFRFR